MSSRAAEGDGSLLIRMQNMDVADAFAGMVTQANLLRTDNIAVADGFADVAAKINAAFAALRTAGVILN